MRFKKVQDILDHAREVHHRVSQYYRQAEINEDIERIRILLEYLSRHEKNIEESLADFEERASEDLLNSYIESPDEEHKHPRVSIQPGMSVDEVVQAAIQLDECIIDLYREMAEHAPTESIRAVFSNLLENEEHEKINLVRNSLRIEDL